MNCPCCAKTLTKVKAYMVTVQTCSGCGGIWFDSNSLAIVAANIASYMEPDKDDHVRFKPRDIIRPGKLSEKYRLCPACGRAMKKINYACDSNIIIDRCPACEGVWTDKGEIQKIAEHIKYRPEVMALARNLLKNELEEDIFTMSAILKVITFIVYYLLRMRL